MKKLLQRVPGFALLGFFSAFILSQSQEASQLQIIGSAFGAERPPIIIAHVAPTTGRFALHAEADRRGAEMAIEEFNDRGGVLGREVVLVSRNPSLDKNHAVRVAEDLITQNKVGFMLGAIDSGVAASMSAVCQKHGVIFINTNSSAPSESVENAHRTKFVFDASAANVNRALLKYALANRKAKRVLLLTEDDAWGRSSAATSRSYIAEYGGTVVGEVVVPEALPDPAGALRQIAAIPADVVAINISGDNQIRLFAQIDPETLEKQSWVVGEVDWEELYPAPGTPRPLYGITWAWNLDTPGTADFVARYRKRFGHSRLDFPGDVTHAAYFATKALLTSIVLAGTTDNHAVIRQLENFKWTAKERMQHDAAYIDPVSHHLQQTIYIATWKPRVDHPERGQVILGHASPEQVRYERERTTRLESFADTPHYAP
ncbi:ABC transporter substrate-binding protein [Sulfurimicrobium lacus]|uniref:ABC transporter substrate-binding protein n=1 Tax=Sulfurimicrobium lacus TaxID=2715678 RepID=UPI00156678B0|nr:ABC transporter substrate-binding protein [Sulfurimicrobium lacus]